MVKEIIDHLRFTEDFLSRSIAKDKAKVFMSDVLGYRSYLFGLFMDSILYLWWLLFFFLSSFLWRLDVFDFIILTILFLSILKWDIVVLPFLPCTLTSKESNVIGVLEKLCKFPNLCLGIPNLEELIRFIITIEQECLFSVNLHSMSRIDMKTDHFIFCCHQIIPELPVFYLCLVEVSVVEFINVFFLYVVLSLEKRFRPITVSLGKGNVIVGLSIVLFERLFVVI